MVFLICLPLRSLLFVNEKTLYCAAEVVNCRYGASLGGTLCYTHNATLRLSSRIFLHTTSDNGQTRCNTQHKHRTNTITMVVESPTPPAEWI